VKYNHKWGSLLKVRMGLGNKLKNLKSMFTFAFWQ
jgi:hypothetical protein